MNTRVSKVRVIVQARTDSSRLPGKALLPVAGVSSAVLVAKRSANRGHDVVLATTDREIDDLLAGLVSAAGIRVFRGNAFDVRARFLAAAADMSDPDIIVRLTADNLFPDGELIGEFLGHFHRLRSDYLNVSAVWQDPPYGLGVEIMRLGALRSAALSTNTSFEREHVTPALRSAMSDRFWPVSYFRPQESGLRCTMDTLDDFWRVNRVFQGIKDPVRVGWRELLQRLSTLPDAPPVLAPGPRLVLGTAQLAAPYGSVVKVSPPEESEAIELVRRAVHCGAVAIDTARAYSGSEKMVGSALRGGWKDRVKIVTKLAPLANLDPSAPPGVAATAAELCVLRSVNALGQVKPHLLIHRAEYLTAWGGAVWERLKALRDEGLVDCLGVSVQSVQEAEAAVECPDVRIIQLPFNILDHRWNKAGIPLRFEMRPDLEIHVRSVFLQGVLLRKADAWPPVQGVSPADLLDRLQQLAKQLDRSSVADLCLAWVRAHSWIDGVILGMERVVQLEENLGLFARRPLRPDEVSVVRAALPELPDTLLNPALWSHVSAGPDKALKHA